MPPPSPAEAAARRKPADSPRPPGGAVVLAAGSARRFGSDKRHHRLPDGNRLLFASLARYSDAFADVLVVLRPEDDRLAHDIGAARLPGQVRAVFCPDARLGMGHSLACGARAAVEAHWRWLFVALGDMAWVRKDTLRRLRDALLSAEAPAIVQPTCGGVPGHPVGFAGAYLQALTTLTGDEGAKDLLRRAGPALHRIAVDDPGVGEDLDVPPGSGS